MSKLYKRILMMAFTIVLLTCVDNVSIASNTNLENKFIKYRGGKIIKYSNVLLKQNEKEINIPIFQGKSGTITFDDLQKMDKEYVLGNIVVKAKTNKVKKTLLEFLNFYKGSLLKDNDINKPTIIGGEGDSYIIWYDFVCEGINSSMMIHLAGDEKNMDELDKKQIRGRDRTIDMIKLDETSEGFYFDINIGEESGFKK